VALRQMPVPAPASPRASVIEYHAPDGSAERPRQGCPQSMRDAGSPKETGFVRSLLIIVGMTLLFLVLLEGICSLALTVNELARHSRRPLAERSHTRYDPLLGWSNIPNLALASLYGPGIDFRTNSQGVRNDRDFDAVVPRDKVRALCVGDSFTLGYGVDNEQPWCQILTTLDGHLETVNMGQGGYGLDQSYLWYTRDGVRLRHDLVIFAFITEDFFRVARDTFAGYGKPVLKVVGNRLVTTNVPVPRRAYYLPWLTQNARLFNQLKVLEVLERVLARVVPERGSAADPDPGQIRDVASRIFEELQRTAEQQHAVLVLVHLPVLEDYEGRASDPWREFVRGESTRRGIPFLEVADDLRRLPADRVGPLFNEHYTVEGNRFVAQAIYSKLRALPPVVSRLSLVSGRASPTSR